MCPGSDVHGRLEEIPWPERSCSLTEEPSENAEMRSVPDRQTHLALVFFSLPLRIDRTADSGSQVVAMMQAAESWLGLNSASRIGVLPRFTTGGRSLGQRKMCSVVLVVADVLTHQSFQMPFIYDDHMVEEIPAAASDPTLSNTVLPTCASPKCYPGAKSAWVMLIAIRDSQGCVVAMIPSNTVKRMDSSARTVPM